MLKGIAKSQIRLSEDKTNKLNTKLEVIQQEQSHAAARCIGVERELEYWKGVKNTAEIFLEQLAEQEQREREEFEDALTEVPMDLSIPGGPVSGNL